MHESAEEESPTEDLMAKKVVKARNNPSLFSEGYSTLDLGSLNRNNISTSKDLLKASSKKVITISRTNQYEQNVNEEKIRVFDIQNPIGHYSSQNMTEQNLKQSE